MPKFADDRQHLACVSHWMRTHGWEVDAYPNARRTVGARPTRVRWEAREGLVFVEPHGRQPSTVRVASVSQAVDVLVALGVLPVGLASDRLSAIGEPGLAPCQDCGA